LVHYDLMAETPVARMRVSDFMERDVVTLYVGERLDLAGDVMHLGRIRHMPVMDGARLVGILSQRDLFRAAASTVLHLSAQAERDWLAQVPVAEVMTTDVVTTGPDESIRHAAELMLIRRVGCLPVVEDGKLLGLISESDCLRVLTALLAYRDGSADTDEGDDGTNGQG